MRKQKRKSDYQSNNELEALTVNGVTIVNPKRLAEKYNLTIEEILFLKELTIFKEYEYLPVRKDGVKTGKKVFAPPISVATFDYYYGVLISYENGLHAFYTMFNPWFYDGTERNMELAKSIFKKVSPDLYSQCFE